MKEFFSNILGDTGGAPQGKSHNIVGELGPRGFLTFRLLNAEPQEID